MAKAAPEALKGVGGVLGHDSPLEQRDVQNPLIIEKRKKKKEKRKKKAEAFSVRQLPKSHSG